MKDDLRYTPTDCFETFPFPSEWENNGSFEVAGREYYEARAALMEELSEGLTKTYNRFHDPEETSPGIFTLRRLHSAIDRVVLDAYGWTDLPNSCEFLLDYEDEDDEADGKARKRKKPWRYRWPDAVRDEVLARLLKLNAERAEQERVTGEAASPSKGAKKRRKSRAKKSARADSVAEPAQDYGQSPTQGELFE